MALTGVSMEKVLAKIRDEVEAGYRHAFVLTQNVHDAVWYSDGHRLSFAGALCIELSRSSTQGRQRCVARYGLSHGVRLYANGHRVGRECDVLTRFEQRTGLRDMVVRDVTTPDEIVGRLRDPGHVLPALYPWLRMEDSQNSLIIDGAEWITGRGEARPADLTERVVLETLQRWARSTELRQRQGCLILLCPRLGDIPRELVEGDGVFEVVPVEYPSRDERLAFLQQRGATTDDVEMLANLTTGFRRVDLDEVVKRRMSADAIAERKAEMITARCGDTVELVRSTHGLEHANAQPHVKAYLEWLRDEIMRDRRSPVVPTGLLFVGVPGNGKSHLARAFAHDCGMNMLRLKNVRSMWVGESERNLETVLDLLPSLAPSVVFMDEIDQLFAARTASPRTGGSGVDERLLGRLLEFMGDPSNRGDIIWIGATNRPDLLDIAAIRRFDRVFPFMNPTDEARAELINDLLHRLDINTDAKFNPHEAAALMKDFSCDEVEKTLRRAYEYARKSGRHEITVADVQRTASLFQHNYDPAMHELIALLSIQGANSRADLPWFDESGQLRSGSGLPDFLADLADAEGKLDSRSLSKRITQLRAQVRAQ